jgi:hypothetical protein
MGIAANLEEFLVDFEVYGLNEEVWNKFGKGKNYDAFLVKRELLLNL